MQLRLIMLIFLWLLSWPLAGFASQVSSNKLTTYTLDKLTMIGTITNSNKTWAIVRAPDQRVYPVALGSAIGKSRGHVTEITSQRIVVTEEAEDANARPLALPQIVSLWLSQTG